MRVTATTLFAALSVAAIAPVSAQTQLTDRSQISNPSTLDWSLLGSDGFSPANPFSVGIIGSATTDGGFGVFVAGSSWNGGFLPGESLLYNGAPDFCCSTYTDFVFNTTLTAFGTQLWSDYPTDQNGTFTLDAYNNGSFITSFTIPAIGGAAANNGQAPFLGIADANGFNEIKLTQAGNPNSCDGGSLVCDQFSVNELTYSTSEVPEPSDMALLATGLVGLSGFGLRRRKA